MQGREGMEQTKKRKIVRKSEKISLGIILAIFFIYAATLVFSFLWLIVNSGRGYLEFFLKPMALPENWFANLVNYAVIFREFDMLEMAYNSVFLSAAQPTVSIFFTTCVAYAYARHEFRLKKALYVVALIPMVVAVAGTMPASYRLINDIGMYDNMYYFVLTSTGGFGINFLLIASVFQNVSGTYKEAAEIDGAGQWTIFLRIYVPQASSIITAMWILSFIATWNDYMTPYLYLPSYKTLSTGIYFLQAQIEVGNGEYVGDYPKLFAAMVIAILPVIVLFLCFQKTIMSYSFGGGIKE